MKKFILSFLLLFISVIVLGQKVDTVIHTKIYNSYFNYANKQPVYVSYILYKGGGNVSREDFHFKNDTKIKCATSKDYVGSGYDKGHLANAEDFANDSTYDELTFRYYNCLPQTPNLNRGLWKNWEMIIREESQTDSLQIICGGSNYQLIGKLYVPKYCWKVVKNLKTKQITHILYFTNSNFNTVTIYKKIEDLEKQIGYKIVL